MYLAGGADDLDPINRHPDLRHAGGSCAPSKEVCAVAAVFTHSLHGRVAARGLDSRAALGAEIAHLVGGLQDHVAPVRGVGADGALQGLRAGQPGRARMRRAWRDGERERGAWKGECLRGARADG